MRINNQQHTSTQTHTKVAVLPSAWMIITLLLTAMLPTFSVSPCILDDHVPGITKCGLNLFNYNGGEMWNLFAFALDINIMKTDFHMICYHYTRLFGLNRASFQFEFWLL